MVLSPRLLVIAGAFVALAALAVAALPWSPLSAVVVLFLVLVSVSTWRLAWRRSRAERPHPGRPDA